MSNPDVVKVHSERRYKAGYVIRDEEWLTHFEDKPRGDTMRLKTAYTHNGDWIGDAKWADRLCKTRGIRPELASPDHTVCSIGFCERDQKWYGWSHRAIYGFGIGHTVKPGDCGYRPNEWGHGGWIAQTLDDAKQMAIDFARAVS